MFLGKGVLKICSKFTGEHPCQSVISIKLQSNFIEITLWYGFSPVDLLHIFTALFYKNTYEELFLNMLTLILIVPLKAYQFLSTIYSFLHKLRFVASNRSWAEAALQKSSYGRCSENMQLNYRRTPVPKCDFNKVKKQLYWNHTLAWVFSYKFAAYFCLWPVLSLNIEEQLFDLWEKCCHT